MVSYFIKFDNLKGNSALSPAHGKGGARATIQNVSAPPLANLSACVHAQAGKIRSEKQAASRGAGLVRSARQLV